MELENCQTALQQIRFCQLAGGDNTGYAKTGYLSVGRTAFIQDERFYHGKRTYQGTRVVPRGKSIWAKKASPGK